MIWILNIWFYVFVSDSRISVYIDVDTWVLVLLKVSAEDEATYECHVNSDPPKKLAIHLIVQGKSNLAIDRHQHMVVTIFALLSPNNDCYGWLWAAS